MSPRRISSVVVAAPGVPALHARIASQRIRLAELLMLPGASHSLVREPDAGPPCFAFLANNELTGWRWHALRLFGGRRDQ
jgi:hypothetical protein